MTLNALLIGIAGGIASALLFSAIMGGGLLAFPLFVVSPLPVAIAALGWGSLSGIVAAAAAGGALAGAISPMAGFLFLALCGAPTAYAAHLLGLARPVDETRPEAGLEWYPLGRVLAALAIAAPVAIIAVGIALGFGVDDAAETLADALIAMTQESGGPVPERAAMVETARLYLRIMPITVTMLWLAMLATDLWLAAKVVRISGRLRRPWTDVAAEVDLPRVLAYGFVGGVVAMMLGGSLGLAGGAVAGGIGMAFALQGLAVVHVVTRPNPARQVILALLYGATFMFSLPLIPLALLGMADAFTGIRARRLANGPRA